MGRDDWFEVKPGFGAIVEEFTAADEFAELCDGSDLVGMSPEDVLVGLESGSFGFLREGE